MIGIRPRSTLSACLVAWLLASCGDELTGPDVVARVAAEELQLTAFESYLQQSSIRLDAGLDAAVLTQLFDEFLDEHVLRLMAVDEGLVDEDSSHLEALDALLADRLDGTIEDERVLLYYRSHAAQFDRPERVRLSQILVPDREAADRALADLRSGAAFEDVARRESIEPTAAIGGDQGFLGREDLPPAFVETIFGLEEGVASEIVRADYGFHIFLVTERRAAEAVTFDAAAGEIREKLRAEDAQQARSQLVAEARGRYNTRVYASNLPFSYKGLRASG